MLQKGCALAVTNLLDKKMIDAAMYKFFTSSYFTSSEEDKLVKNLGISRKSSNFAHVLPFYGDICKTMYNKMRLSMT